MMGRFNKGLEAADFRYFIAGGATAQRLDKYEGDCFEFARNVSSFAENNGHGLAHLFNRAYQVEVDGLNFAGRQMPANWMSGGNRAVPRDLGTVGQMSTLKMRHAFMYFSGELTRKGNELYAAVARKVERENKEDLWVVASPVVDGKCALPPDSQEIDLKTYAEMVGRDAATVRSPAVDPNFEPPFRDGFPFPRSTPAAPALVNV